MITLSDGSLVVTGSDGSKTLTGPDGSSWVLDPRSKKLQNARKGKSEVSCTPDATAAFLLQTGGAVQRLTDGSFICSGQDSSRMLVGPDGSQWVLRPDGSCHCLREGCVFSDLPSFLFLLSLLCTPLYL
jgi:hypothetical protein